MKTPRSTVELDQVRDDILQSALAIISSRGYESLTMRGLASRAGMTAPNLYNYFSNKDEIYLTLVAMGFEKLLEALEEARAQTPDPVDRARALMEAYVRFGTRNSSFYDIMFTRPAPKYHDYVGTPHEKLSQREYAVSMEIAELAVRSVEQVKAGRGSMDRETVRTDVVRIWCVLHGMVSLLNSRIVGYVAEDTEKVYDRIMEGLVGSFLA